MLAIQLFSFFPQQHVLPLCYVHGVMCVSLFNFRSNFPCARLLLVPLQNFITCYFAQSSFFLIFYLCSLEYAFLKRLPWFVIPTIFATWLLAYGLLLENSDLWTALAASRSFSIETWTESGKSSQLSSAKSKEMQQNHISITSSVIFEFPCCLWIFAPYFQSERCCLNDSLLLVFFKVISDLSALCLPIGSRSGCLRQTPTCVCWMVCNYPQASLGQNFKAPLQTCCSIHGWTSVLREHWGEWEHTENTHKVE